MAVGFAVAGCDCGFAFGCCGATAVMSMGVVGVVVGSAVAVCSGALVQLLLCRWKCMVVALDKTVWMLASVLVLYVCLSVDV